MTDKDAQKIFTGRHMAAILIAFFGVVMTVNFIMARFALSTFGGTVVDNSYVASQSFNEWLAESRAQKALGWTVTVTSAPDDRAIVDARDAGGRAFVRADVGVDRSVERDAGLRMRTLAGEGNEAACECARGGGF